MNLRLGAVGDAGRIPEDYAPDAEARINLYARLARLADSADIDALSDEIEDRFGPQPKAVRELLLATRLKHLCRQAGVARVDAGPQAVALTFRTDVTENKATRRLIRASRGRLAWRDGRLVYARETKSSGERQRIVVKLINKLAETLDL